MTPGTLYLIPAMLGDLKTGAVARSDGAPSTGAPSTLTPSLLDWSLPAD